MLFLSLGLWCVVVYSVRVAAMGNPLYCCVASVVPELRYRAEQITIEQRSPASEAEARFIQRVSLLTTVELVAFLLEVGLLVYLWIQQVAAWLAATLLIKDLAIIALGAWVARGQAPCGLFEGLLRLPSWLIRLDRVSSLVSGVGFLLLFLLVNGWRVL